MCLHEQFWLSIGDETRSIVAPRNVPQGRSRDQFPLPRQLRVIAERLSYFGERIDDDEQSSGKLLREASAANEDEEQNQVGMVLHSFLGEEEFH